MKFMVVWALAAIPLWAQPRIVTTRVYTDAPGAVFTVDGTAYTGAATLLWPEGSKHIISIAPSQLVGPGIQQGFSGWQSSVGALLDGMTVAVTATPEITSYFAKSTKQYLLQIRFNPGGYPFNCTPGPGTGKLFVAGGCYDRDADIWLAADSTVSLEAYPPPRYVFSGWQNSVPAGQAFQTSFVLNKPMGLAPRFEPAAQYTFVTSPPELQVLVDRTPVNTPAALDWAPGSKHLIAPVSPQTDTTSHLFVFDSWSHGGDAIQAYTVNITGNETATITANYAPGARVSFVTQPGGQRLVIDGRENWPSYNFVWKVGSTHHVTAPAEHVDARGRKYAFTGWSNQAPASMDVLVEGTDMRFIAGYDLLAKLTVGANAEVNLTVNGVECKQPCIAEPRQGESVKISAPENIPAGDSMRFDFQGWSDGTATRERVWTGGADEQTITALYRPSYRVAAVADPVSGAAFSFQPASADGFYPEGTEVKLVAQAQPGYRFHNWDGDLTGRFATGTVKATGPRFARAVLDKVPYIGPAGVRNAAGRTPEETVAPGSLIAIDGVNLAPALEAAEGDPLPQSLAGVTVSVADRLLPLMLVSPDQITAQLPSDLAEGDYSISVRWDSGQVVGAPFAVARTAPGLFALAAHADGSAVTGDAPARAGETLTVYGSGLGPYERPVLDGFAVPEGSSNPVKDKVEVLLAGRSLPAVSAVATTGKVGVATIRFKLPDDVTGPSDLAIRIGDKQSNTVSVPIQ